MRGGGIARARRAHRACAALACAALAGCNALFGPEGQFASHANDYLKTRPAPALRYPEGITPPAGESLYPPPARAAADALPQRFVLVSPEPLLNVEQGPRIQTLQDQRWLVVDSQPAYVWPQLRGMLAARGMPPASLDLEAGKITTAWASAPRARRERYQLWLRSGLRLSTAEVQIRQQFWRAGVDGRWPERSDDGDREAELMLALAEHLAPVGLAPIASLAAQRVSQQPRVLLVGEGPALALDMQLDYQRGWALLGLALEKADVRVTEEDPRTGRRFVRWLPDSERGDGFWRRVTRQRKTVEQRFDGQEEILLQLRRIATGRLRLSAQRATPMTHDQTRQFLLLIKGHLG